MVKYKYSLEDFLKLNFEQRKIVLITLFAVCAILSDILAVKIINYGLLTIECGCILFPVVYALNDSLNEVYGEKTMMKTVLLGMGMKILMVIVGTLAVLAPYNPQVFTGQEHLAFVFTFVPRIVIASLIGFAAGSIVNSKLMTLVGNYCNGKYLFIRNILSSVGGEFIDTIIFIGISFYGTMSIEQLIMFMITQYIMKLLIETIIQPVNFKVISWARGNEDMLDYKREDVSL